MQRYGYFEGGLRKVEAARAIARFIDALDRFWSGVDGGDVVYYVQLARGPRSGPGGDGVVEPGLGDSGAVIGAGSGPDVRHERVAVDGVDPEEIGWNQPFSGHASRASTRPWFLRGSVRTRRYSP